jgi:hypothetical protein
LLHCEDYELHLIYSGDTGGCKLLAPPFRVFASSLFAVGWVTRR